jgi:hypothetical protein
MIDRRERPSSIVRPEPNFSKMESAWAANRRRQRVALSTARQWIKMSAREGQCGWNSGGDRATTSPSTPPILPQSDTDGAGHLFDNWFDRIEAGLCDRVCVIQAWARECPRTLGEDYSDSHPAYFPR